MHFFFVCAQIDGVNLPVKRNQALIVKNYCQYSDRLCTQLLGEGEERQAKRWQILTTVSAAALCSWQYWQLVIHSRTHTMTMMLHLLYTLYCIFGAQSDQTDPDLQLLLSFTDLMATCAEGDNPFIDSVCQNLLSVEELIRYTYSSPPRLHLPACLPPLPVSLCYYPVRLCAGEG